MALVAADSVVQPYIRVLHPWPYAPTVLCCILDTFHRPASKWPRTTCQLVLYRGASPIPTVTSSSPVRLLTTVLAGDDPGEPLQTTSIPIPSGASHEFPMSPRCSSIGLPSSRTYGHGLAYGVGQKGDIHTKDFYSEVIVDVLNRVVD
jgi:hypothetical protein